jgi:hypothetical protein
MNIRSSPKKGEIQLLTHPALSWPAGVRATQVMTNSAVPILGQIFPIDIFALNEIRLPFAFEFLEPCFTIDGFANVAECFEIDEFVDAVFLRESGHETLFVFPYAAFEIVGDADIKRAVAFTGEHVDEIGFRHLRLCHLGGPHSGGP